MTIEQQPYLDDVINAANSLIELKETKMTVVEPTEEVIEAATGLIGLKGTIQEEKQTNETESLNKGFADLYNIANKLRRNPRITNVPRFRGNARKTKKKMTKRKCYSKNKRRTRRHKQK